MRYLDDADLKLDVDMYVCTYIRGLMLISNSGLTIQLKQIVSYSHMNNIYILHNSYLYL